MPHSSGLYHLKAGISKTDLRCSLVLCVSTLNCNTVFWLGTYLNIEHLECIRTESIMMEIFNSHSHSQVYLNSCFSNFWVDNI